MGNAAPKPVVVISRTDRIGDLLLSFPAFHKVRELYPDARIIVLVRKYTCDLLYGQDFIDRVLCLDEQPLPELVNILRSEKPDVFVALFTDSVVGYLARKCGATYRVGPYSKAHSWFSYNCGIMQRRSHGLKNEADYNLDLISVLSESVPDAEPYTRLFYGAQHRALAQSVLTSIFPIGATRLVVINPFGGGSAKNISLREYCRLGDLLLAADASLQIVYLARDDAESKRIMQDKTGAQSTFVNTGSILNLVAMIDMASLYIGPSTGPTHIAAFLNKPVVAVYPKIKNQSPTRWGVMGTRKCTYVQPDVSCPQKFGCRENCPHFDCFTSLKAEDMVSVCLSSLS